VQLKTFDEAFVEAQEAEEVGTLGAMIAHGREALLSGPPGTKSELEQYRTWVKGFVETLGSEDAFWLGLAVGGRVGDAVRGELPAEVGVSTGPRHRPRGQGVLFRKVEAVVREIRSTNLKAVLISMDAALCPDLRQSVVEYQDDRGEKKKTTGGAVDGCLRKLRREAKCQT
jgi:hypothetical protein